MSQTWPRLVRLAGRVAVLLGVAGLEVLTPILAVAMAPLFYWRLLVTDPQDAATLPLGDITELHFPYRRWVAEQLARGEPPWWNAFVSGGHSAIGDVQFHTLYPLDTLLAQSVGADFTLRTLELGIIAHVALGALFMYLLARRVTASRVGGLVAAIVFAFGGYLAGFPVQQMILLETSVWLPLILLCVDLGADYNLVTAFVIGAAALALAAMVGHPQTLFYVATAGLLYLAFKGWNGGRVRLAALPGLLILLLGGAALAASALLPAYLHLSLTDRTDVTYAFSASGFSLREAVGLVFPVQFGGAALYHGVFSLLLAAVGLAAPWRRANKLFWLGLGVLGLVLSFGGNTFLEGITYLALGSFKFRDHERLAFYVGVAIAILAGFGAAELARPRRLHLAWLGRSLRWPVAVVLGVVVLLIVGYATGSGSAPGSVVLLADRAAYTALILFLGAGIILGRGRGIVSPGAAALLAVGLVGFDLFTTNWQNNLRPGDPDKLLAASPVVEYLQSYTTGQFRIASEGLLPGDGNAGALFRLEDVVGNSPLETRDYHEFDTTVPELTRWQVLNVRYVVTERKLDDPRFRLLRQNGKQNLYELADRVRLPRAYVVQRVVPAPDHAAALDLVKMVNLRTTAVVEGGPPIPFALDRRDDAASYDQTAPAPGDRQPSAQVVDERSDQVIVEATLGAPGLLVLADVDYPGWQASVDGVAVPIYRTNGIVRGVLLPAGSHRVQFWFDPPGLTLGAAVSQSARTLLGYLVAVEIVARALWLIGLAGARFLRRRLLVA